jgi:peptidoglycan/LPS O-acetylase OafA/YrhL
MSGLESITPAIRVLMAFLPDSHSPSFAHSALHGGIPLCSGDTRYFGTVCVGCDVWMFRKQDLGDNTGSAMWGVILGFPLLSLGLGLITASSVSRNGLLARVKIPGAETIAALAFSLYLTHKAVAHIVMQRFPQITLPQGSGSWLLYAVTCFSAALLLHIAVERPFLRLRDRVARHKSSYALEEEMREEPAL